MNNPKKISLVLYISKPDKKCILCGKEYKIPENKFIAGKGYPRLWTPYCPDCQEKINKEVEQYIIEHSNPTVRKAFEFRKNHLNKYLSSIGIPFSENTEHYGRLDDIKNIAKAVAGNNWLIFSGTPGAGKTYMASLAFRMLAAKESLFDKSMLYRSMTHLIGDIKRTWDEDGFNTGEELVEECIKANMLILEINDTENSKRTTSYRNEILFKIVDQRYMRMKRGLFYPTIYIIVASRGKSAWETLKLQGVDEAIIGRIIELGAGYMFKFNDKDFRKTRALEIKKVTRIG